MRRTLLFILLLGVTFSCKSPAPEISYSNGAWVADMEDRLTEAVMVDMFSPPVASRIYSYSNIALYESMRHTSKAPLHSLAGVLHGLDSLPSPDTTLAYDYRAVALTAFSEVACSMVYTKQIIRNYEQQLTDSMNRAEGNSQRWERSVQFGKQLAAAIIGWAAQDQFKKTRGMIRYTLLHESGSWEPTPPDYMQAAEPHWNKIRTFVLDSASQFTADTLPVPFSTDKKSGFYSNAMDVLNLSRNLDSSHYEIAAFWDDNPGVSAVYGHMKQVRKKMTPGGHWMAVTGQVVRKEKSDMSRAAELFAVTSIAIADAFIACWDAKYRFQTIRPVTYINRYITDDWQPMLQTPPFPEYPSGHATISASAATVLTKMIGTYAYIDSTEYRFGLPVRSFPSFMSAAEECARSRFYGGIHFMPSNLAGTETGKRVGAVVLQKINPKTSN